MTILSQSRGYTMTVCRGLSDMSTRAHYKGENTFLKETMDCYKLCIWRKTGFKCSIGINNIAPFQTLIVLLGRKYKNSPIIILVTKELFAVPSSLPFSLKYYIIDIVRNVGQQSTSGST
jgi:hypothetical protein